jgi:hypothetical protein
LAAPFCYSIPPPSSPSTKQQIGAGEKEVPLIKGELVDLKREHVCFLNLAGANYAGAMLHRKASKCCGCKASEPESLQHARCPAVELPPKFGGSRLVVPPDQRNLARRYVTLLQVWMVLSPAAVPGAVATRGGVHLCRGGFPAAQKNLPEARNSNTWPLCPN